MVSTEGILKSSPAKKGVGSICAHAGDSLQRCIDVQKCLNANPSGLWLEIPKLSIQPNPMEMSL